MQEIIKDGIKKYQIILEITEEEKKALETDMISIDEWCSNALSNKIRQIIDQIVEQSGEGSKFTPPEKKIQIIRKLIAENSPLLKSAIEKQREFEKKLEKGSI